MKLTGIIENVFRGITIFRGYSTLKNLARLSKVENYQREQNSERINDIQNYMSSSPFVFFPELILGWQIGDGNVIRELKENEDAINITIQDNIKLKKNKFKLNSAIEYDDIKTKELTIEIPDELGLPIFSRIDGNHRLSVIDSLLSKREQSMLYDIIVPYCIIIQTKNQESEKYESAYFYLINSKSKPLTTDENLKAIIGTNLFSEIEKESILSLSSDQIKLLDKIVTYINTTSVDFIRDIFNNEIYSFVYILITKVIGNNIVAIQDCFISIKNAIKYIDSIYVKKEINNPQKEIIIAMIAKKYTNEEQFPKFLEWINKNEIATIKHLSFSSLIDVFDNLHKQRSYKVFVAMPYISFKRVNEYNKLFSEILSDVSKKIGFSLELIPIMRFRGESQRIDIRLIEKIKECDIFIGDLTTCNNNVIFEVGLAEGSGKKILLIKAEEDTDKIPFDIVSKLDKGKAIPFDMDKLQYIPYSNSGYYNDIKAIMRNHLPIIINELRNKDL